MVQLVYILSSTIFTCFFGMVSWIQWILISRFEVLVGEIGMSTTLIINIATFQPIRTIDWIRSARSDCGMQNKSRQLLQEIGTLQNMPLRI